MMESFLALIGGIVATVFYDLDIGRPRKLGQRASIEITFHDDRVAVGWTARVSYEAKGRRSTSDRIAAMMSDLPGVHERGWWVELERRRAVEAALLLDGDLGD